MRTAISRLTLAVAALAVSATMAAAPAMAAKEQARPTPIKHSTMLKHQQRASLQARDNSTLKTPGTADAKAKFSNARAEVPKSNESMATQLGKTVTLSGNASDPICKPGSRIAMPDGEHTCQ